MSSINTNFAAMTALESLTRTNNSLLETQSRISTGYRVANAEDNAAYWSMATTMRSDNKALSTVSDALGLGAATIDVAYTAMNSAIDVVTELKTQLVSARQPGVDKAKVQTWIDELQNQLRTIASSASVAGENWLAVDVAGSSYQATEEVVASFARSSGVNGEQVSVGTLSIDVASSFLFNADTDGAGGVSGSGAATADALGILASARLTRDDADTAGVARGSIDAAGTIVIANYDPDNLGSAPAEIDITNASVDDLDDYIQAVDAALSEMTSGAANLGAAKKRIDIQKDFVTNLMSALDRGISSLVDADMNAESTKLQALQVQQQLGIQALSIANSSSQNILSLFR
ncbi:MAG: flagellin [Hyphomicrobiaceae bacterium]|uniref:flagellin N-terminal helical domain-containing protein n=1 Tax=Pseudorhodoplanes sp. TaxID=1934341 RepID=UPI003D0988EF